MTGAAEAAGFACARGCDLVAEAAEFASARCCVLATHFAVSPENVGDVVFEHWLEVVVFHHHHYHHHHHHHLVFC